VEKHVAKVTPIKIPARLHQLGLILPDFPQASLDQGKRREGVSLQLMHIQTESVYRFGRWLGVPTHE
jgi:hypothetical protein